MPSLVPLMAVAVAGVALPPAKPTLAHTASGQFTISNYDSLGSYTLSATAGSISRAGAVVTMTNASSAGTITPVSQKGIPGTATQAERKSYDATQGGADTSYLHANPAHGVNIPNVIGARWTYCSDCGGGTGSENCHQEGTMVKAATPGGYSDSYGEWWRVA